LSKTFNVRFYEPGDEKQIVELLDLVFDGWPKIDIQSSKLEYWLWKHQDSLTETNCVTVGETPEGKIVGCLHAPLFNVKLGEVTQKFYQGVDLAVHPEYRRMGMYKQMDDRFGDDYIAYNYTANPIVMKKPLENNRPRLPFIRKYVHINDYGLFCKQSKRGTSMIKKFGLNTLKTLNKFIHRRYGAKDNAIDIRDIEAFTEDVNEIGRQTGENNIFTLLKDNEYLNWRYCDPRGPKYRIRGAYRKKNLVGYCISKNNLIDPSYPKGYIVDIGVINENTCVVTNLVKDALGILQENGANEVNIFIINGHEYEKIVKSTGFVDSRADIFIWFGSENEKMEENLRKELNTDPNKIMFHAGDLDII